MDLTIGELARAVDKSEAYVRQHIHRKHLTVRKDGRNVSVAREEAVRWARERSLSFDLSTCISVTTGTMEGRIARVTVLACHVLGKEFRNLFTLIRHRRQDALGPWAREPDETWYSEDLGHELRLFIFDAVLERCESLVDNILDSGVLEIDGFEIRYDLEPTPRRHRAFRDHRGLADAAMLSPFSRHSAEIIEHWSFTADLHKRWLEVLESLQGKAPLDLSRLGFSLDRCPDRVGNLMIAGAEDAIASDLVVNHDRTLTLHVDTNELLPGAYRATVWASHCGNEVLRREVSVMVPRTLIEIASDVDHIGFAMYRSVDGECVDLMDTYLIKEVSVALKIESDPTLHLRNRQSRTIHKVNAPSLHSTINVDLGKDSDELDKGIRRLWLDRRGHERETSARREGKFARFEPTEFDQAVQHLIHLLCQDPEQSAPIYLADPYFMSPLEEDEGEKLYLDLFSATTGRPLRILCASGQNGSAQPWWLNYPGRITAHVSVRSFHKQNTSKRGFHDRYLITPKREFIITHSLNGWLQDGVTFAGLPYDIYRAEAERLWSMDIGSPTTALFVREIC